MSKDNAEHLWIEAGYKQFAEEGLEGIGVERLARITGLNKAGYYHYFGDRDTFLEKLMAHHLHLTKPYTDELKQVKQFDPEYIELLIKYTIPLMVNSQLVRNRHVPLFANTHRLTNDKVDPVLSKLFADFIGFSDHMEFSSRYYDQVRYMFHSQITFERMNYPFLRNFLYEAREVIRQAVELAKST